MNRAMSLFVLIALIAAFALITVQYSITDDFDRRLKTVERKLNTSTVKEKVYDTKPVNDP